MTNVHHVAHSVNAALQTLQHSSVHLITAANIPPTFHSFCYDTSP